MGGSMDERPIHVWRKEDYHYVVVSESPFSDERPHAEIWMSPACGMTRPEIAAELRRLADFVESIP